MDTFKFRSKDDIQDALGEFQKSYLYYTCLFDIQ